MSKESIYSNSYILMGVLLIFWGSFAAVSKLLLAGLDSFQVLFFIFGIAAVIMTIMFIASGKSKLLVEVTLKDYLKLAVIAVPQFLYYSLYTLSLRLIPAVEASMINYLFPVFIILLALPINNEKLTPSVVISTFTGFFGVVIIITGGRLDVFKISSAGGGFLALGAAISWALFSNLGKRNSVDSYVSNYVYTIVCFILSCISLFLFSNYRTPGMVSLAGCIWLGISNILSTYFIWLKVLKQSSSSAAANLSFFTPFITLLFIGLLTKERITPMHILGVLVIFSSTIILNHQKISGLLKNQTVH